jgi:prepilin signal peptidase PulO-like enzyme (type II secretory pathway)
VAAIGGRLVCSASFCLSLPSNGEPHPPEQLGPQGRSDSPLRLGMNAGAGLACGLAGVAVGLPVTAIAHSIAPQGRAALARAWWLGRPASRTQVAAVVLATGLSAGAVGGRIGWSLVLVAYWVSAVVGVMLAFVDIRSRRLPYEFTVPMYAVCFACFGVASIAAGEYTALVHSATAGAITVVGFMVLALTFAGQLGLGDVALAGWLAMSLGWLGWDRVVLGLVAGWVLQAIVGVVQIVRRRTGIRDALPMGPALLAGWLVGVLS